MSKVDWTKPIEWVNSTGNAIKVNFVHDADGESCMIETPYGNIHCDEYGVLVGGVSGCVRNVADSEAAGVELAVNIDEGFATLRDQFAMTALQRFCVNSDEFEDYETIAIHSYRVADAMMEARKKGN